MFRYIGLLLIVGLGWSGMEQLAANNGFESDRIKQNKADHELHITAKGIYDEQIISAQIEANHILKNKASRDQKACVSMLGDGVYSEKPLYWKVQSCNIASFDIKSLKQIKEELKAS